jgi:ABC-type sulfate/molybdate transport systems ATPase subunit
VTSGEILIAGEDVARMPAHKRDIGMVFQHYALFPHMTAAQNVAFPLEQRKVPKDEISRRVTSALSSVHLEDFAARLPRQLSGGQQQRVAVARALASRPTVMFADEPTGNLDSATSAEILALMRALVDSFGQTTVMVTHDPHAAAIADRVLFLADGQIVRDLDTCDAHTVIATMEELSAS